MKLQSWQHFRLYGHADPLFPSVEQALIEIGKGLPMSVLPLWWS